MRYTRYFPDPDSAFYVRVSKEIAENTVPGTMNPKQILSMAYTRD